MVTWTRSTTTTSALAAGATPAGDVTHVVVAGRPGPAMVAGCAAGGQLGKENRGIITMLGNVAEMPSAVVGGVVRVRVAFSGERLL